MLPADRPRTLWRALSSPEVAEMIVTTHICPEGSVSVTVESDSDDEHPKPLSTLALEDLAGQSIRSAVTAWVTIHRRTADDTG
jgi:hypothetical protein